MVMVDEPEPGAAIEVGLKLAVAPVGRPLAESEIAELKPPETVVLIVDVPEVPCTSGSEAGDALIEKSALLRSDRGESRTCRRRGSAPGCSRSESWWWR